MKISLVGSDFPTRTEPFIFLTLGTLFTLLSVRMKIHTGNYSVIGKDNREAQLKRLVKFLIQLLNCLMFCLKFSETPLDVEYKGEWNFLVV